jgi:uncharacterized protein (TIGR02646 family)
MKFIEKQEEPPEFKAWKEMANENWQPSWDNFGDNYNGIKPKTALHIALLKEQGYICCYCARRIDKSNSHIEHLQPRSPYSDLSLEYSNLMASCQGYSEDDEVKLSSKLIKFHKHCGHCKGVWYDPTLMVSPLDQDCASYFKYTGAGEIIPTQEALKVGAAKETIKRLGLNYAGLMRDRAKVAGQIVNIVENLEKEDIEKLVNSYKVPNSDGKYERFCSVILYFLESLV